MAAMTLSVTGTGCAQAQEPSTKETTGNAGLPKVYFIKEINPENLVKVYEALGRKAEGKVAVKLSDRRAGRAQLPPAGTHRTARKGSERYDRGVQHGPTEEGVPIRKHI